MTHRDGLSALSVRSQYRRDALHHKILAPPFNRPGPGSVKRPSLWVIIITLWSLLSGKIPEELEKDPLFEGFMLES